jgi:hypothetical protein
MAEFLCALPSACLVSYVIQFDIFIKVLSVAWVSDSKAMSYFLFVELYFEAFYVLRLSVCIPRSYLVTLLEFLALRCAYIIFWLSLYVKNLFGFVICNGYSNSVLSNVSFGFSAFSK